jgi:hypothetical protein
MKLKLYSSGHTPIRIKTKWRAKTKKWRTPERAFPYRRTKKPAANEPNPSNPNKGSMVEV